MPKRAGRPQAVPFLVDPRPVDGSGVGDPWAARPRARGTVEVAHVEGAGAPHGAGEANSTWLRSSGVHARPRRRAAASASSATKRARKPSRSVTRQVTRSAVAKGSEAMRAGARRVDRRAP
jgi:hypothetical protein